MSGEKASEEIFGHWPYIDPEESLFSRELLPETTQEIDKIADLFAVRGLSAHVGLELEFSLESANQKQLIILREKLISELPEHGLSADEFRNAKAFAESAEASEILVYYLYRTSWSEYLNPDFKTSFDLKLIRDADRVTEIQTIPVDVKEVSRIKQGVSKEIALIAKELKLVPVEGGELNYHVNMSFEDEKGNLFSDDHPDYLTTGKTMAEGMAYSLSRSLMFLYPANAYASPRSIGLELTPGRQGGIRAADGRMEIKYSNQDGKQDIETTTLLALIGAIYGYDSQGVKNDIVRAEVVDVPVVKRKDKKLKVFNHVLNESFIGTNGELVIDKKYVDSKFNEIIYELGLIKERIHESAFSQMFSSFMANEELPILMSFLTKIKIDRGENGWRIDFPRNDGDNYAFIEPAVIDDSLPRKIKDRLLNGGELTQAERDKYLLPGQGSVKH